MGTRAVFAQGHLAVCRAYLGDRRPAREAVITARALANETGRPVDVQFALLHDGIVTELEGRVADSIPLFEAALGMARKAELPFFEDWILVELGEALLALGDDRRALALLEATCARSAARVVPQFDALARAALGKALTLAGRTEAAEATLMGVLEYAHKVGHRQLEQMALRRLAVTLEQTDPARALASVEKAMAVAEAAGLLLGLAKSLEVKLVLLLAQGRHLEAEEVRVRTVAVQRSLSLPAQPGFSELVA
jgi:ATP/maltotriose-dependent transcriptional regulator MalT